MKKFSKLISLFCLAAMFVLASCSSPSSGGNDEGPHIGLKSPREPKEVGDIVFNDGSATPYAKIVERAENDEITGKKITADEQAAAIAVIFYVGTGLNSDDNKGNPDNTTKRTLGVGFKHDKNGLSWCIDKAQGYSWSRASSCSYIKNEGIYTFSGSKNGSNGFEKIGKTLRDYSVDPIFASYSISDDTNDLDKYPAFKFGKEYSTPATVGKAYDKTDWYLPSVAELYEIYKVKEIVNEVSSFCEGDLFGSDKYWSSSGDLSSPTTYANCIEFSDGTVSGMYKDYDFAKVCAIHEF